MDGRDYCRNNSSTAHIWPSHSGRGPRSRGLPTAGRRGRGQTKLLARASPPGLCLRHARRLPRYPRQPRPLERVPASCSGPMPTGSARFHDQLLQTGSQSGKTSCGTGDWQLHGGQPNSADRTMPSGGMLRWPTWLVLCSRRAPNESPLIGSGGQQLTRSTGILGVVRRAQARCLCYDVCRGFVDEN
jgi:hypothetical protein